MDMNDLLKLLKEQHQLLHAFHDTIVLQQKVIINNDVKGLEETIKTEGALLINIELYEKHVEEVIKQLSDKYGIKNSSGKLSEFIDAIKVKREINSINLIKLQNSLQKMVTQTVRVNNQNKMLIDQARYFIKETIAALISKNRTSILDRKV
ncbi:MAG: flagellar protein FlgN [Bacteroidetes bacterium]|nr:flagellar protein FlgN [Bacteroidota bacterium]